MAKRFCDTDIWKNQRWFRKLTPEHKLAFCYIKDECNHAGIWKIDCSDLIEDLGIPSFNIQEFIDAVNTEFDKISGEKVNKERIRVINTSLWITGFIQYQYEGKDSLVNPDASPVRTALIILEGLGTLSEGIQKGYIKLTKPLQEGWRTPKVKDKDKDNKYRGKKNISKAVKISEDVAVFEDGSEQELGESQLYELKQGRLSPRQVVKGHVY